MPSASVSVNGTVIAQSSDTVVVEVQASFLFTTPKLIMELSTGQSLFPSPVFEGRHPGGLQHSVS